MKATCEDGVSVPVSPQLITVIATITDLFVILFACGQT